MEDMFVVIMLIVAIGVIIFLSRKSLASGNQGHYDEMQNMIRFKGYRIAYFSTIICLGILIFSYSIWDNLKNSLNPEMGIFIAIMVGLVSFTIYCIRKDAFFRIGQDRKAYIGLIGAVIICNIIPVIVRIIEGDFLGGKPLDFTKGGSNLVLAISFTFILIALLIGNDSREDGVEK